MAAKPKLLSKSAYAARRGVNPSQISRYVQRGMPCHGGMIDPAEADWWCEQHLDPTKPRSKVTDTQHRKVAAEKAPDSPPAAPKAKAGTGTPSQPPPQPPAQPPPPPSDPADPSTVPNLNEARAWDIHFSALRRKQQLEQADRELIPLAEVEAFVDAANLTYWQGLEGVAGRIASQIAAVCGGDVAVIGELIRNEHRAVRAAVARRFDELGAVREAAGAVPPDGSLDPPAAAALD